MSHNQLHMLAFFSKLDLGSTCNVDRSESSETQVTINEQLLTEASYR